MKVMRTLKLRNWSTFGAVVAAILVTPSLASAAPITIEFNITSIISNPYQEDGFDFNGYDYAENPLGFAGPFVNNFVSTYGTPSIVTMTSQAGDMWDVLEMQVCGSNTSIGSKTLNFTGTQYDGTVLSTSFVTTGNTTAPQTVSFTGFTNLTEFTFTTEFTAFDNLVVDNIQPIPEPASLTLLILGGLFVGMWGRKSRMNC
jgi:hypothetical protein